MSDGAPVYLTTKELAELLRVKERKVYDMAAAGEVPCSRATGKLLFPREDIEAWLAQSASGPALANLKSPRSNIIAGSHDPLLEWAVRESRCGLATAFDSSMDGLSRFAAGEGVCTGLHVRSDDGASWNSETVLRQPGLSRAVLVEWARRRRGLVVNSGSGIASLADLAGKRVAARQSEAGSQMLFQALLQEAGVDAASLEWTKPARSEADAVLLVQEGAADACFGLGAIAGQFKLGFAALLQERYDLLVDQAAWFEPEFQALHRFCRTEAFAARASSLAGYDVSDRFTVHLNLS